MIFNFMNKRPTRLTLGGSRWINGDKLSHDKLYTTNEPTSAISNIGICN